MRLKFLVFLILILTIGGFGSLIWYRFYRPAAPGPYLQPQLVNQPNPSQVAERIEELTNPFVSEPCFVANTNTCQTVFFHPEQFGPERLETQAFVLSQQSSPTQFFSFGRMLVARGALTQYYAETLTLGGQAQPYLEFARRLAADSWEQQLNPALVYSLYEQLFIVTRERPLGSPLAVPQPSARDFGASYQAGKGKLIAPGGDDPLIEALRTRSWSLEAKALVYALAQNLAPGTVVDFFAEEGALERQYLALFAPVGVDVLKRVEYSDQPIGPDRIYAEEVEPWFTVICRAGAAQVCRLAGEALTCAPAPLFNPDCSINLINLD